MTYKKFRKKWKSRYNVGRYLKKYKQKVKGIEEDEIQDLEQ